MVSRALRAFTCGMALLWMFLALTKGVKFNAADKIRANSNKVARQNVRITQKQQAAPPTKALTPKFGGKRTGKTSSTRRCIAGFSTKTVDDASPMIQLFMRRTETGPWNFFNEIVAEGRLRPLTEDIIDSGGLQAEILRVSLEKGLTTKMFGRDFWVLSGNDSEEDDLSYEENDGDDGSGFDELSPLDERDRFDTAYATAVEARKKLVKVAKESAPAFRKVHGRDIQFGYRISAEGEPIYHIPSHVDILHMSSSSDKPFFWDDGSVRCEPEDRPVEPILMDQILDSPPSGFKLSDDWNQCTDAILHTVENFVAVSQDQGPTYSLLDPNSKITVRGERGKIDLTDEYGGDSRGFAFDLYICSDGSAHLRHKKCVRASGGLYAAFVNVNDPREGQDLGLSAMAVHLSDVAGFVSSPFDAELAASIGSVILARQMVNRITKNGDQSPAPRGRITFLTDSKTLCRSLRSGPSSNKFSERSTPSRIASWRFLMEQIDELSDMGHSVHTRWIPGHPERRHRTFNEWSFLDGAIWAADIFACEKEILNMIHTTENGEAVLSQEDDEDAELISQCQALGLKRADPSVGAEGVDNEQHTRANVVRVGFKDMILCSRNSH